MNHHYDRVNLELGNGCAVLDFGLWLGAALQVSPGCVDYAFSLTFPHSWARVPECDWRAPEFLRLGDSSDAVWPTSRRWCIGGSGRAEKPTMAYRRSAEWRRSWRIVGGRLASACEDAGTCAARFVRGCGGLRFARAYNILQCRGRFEHIHTPV